MFQTSHIELSESAIKNNIDFIKRTIGEQVIFSSVVKGNAYGHGIEHYCPLAYKYGTRHFSVFSAQEAYNVKKALTPGDYTLMIMGFIDNSELRWAIENQVEFYIFELDRLHEAIKIAKEIQQPALVHIELETGMNRTGLTQKELDYVITLIEENNKHIQIKGICSHLAGAESIANYKRIKDQISRFNRYQKKLATKEPWKLAKKHIASSSALMRYPNTRLDIVRVGILQYGYFPTSEIHVHYLSKHKSDLEPLKRVISWKSQVMDTKTVKVGEFVGYGMSFLTNQATRIAIVPVGYSYGYSRSLSNKGKVLINGQRFDVIGTINMNMLAVNITNAEGIEKGAEVTLIGDQGDLDISVSSFSEHSNLINYELLTRLPVEIPRIIT